MITAMAILERAEQILVGGTVQSTHGPYCPWCALADAKGALETEAGIPVWESLAGLHDRPLFEAKLALGNTAHDTLDRDDALRLLRDARKSLP